MKKICILQNDIAFGGTDTFVINLSRGLVADGYDVTVVLSCGEKFFSEERADELKNTGAKIVKTCSLNNGIKGKLKHLKLLYKELKRGKYDVFQTNIDLFNGPNLFVAWLAGVPVRVCHSHNSQQGRELSEGKTFRVRIYQKVMKWLCWTFSNRRCGCSGIAMDFLFQKKWKKDKNSRVVHNGIDLNKFKLIQDKDQLKNKLGFHNKYNIVTVGRISYQKNPEFLLDCFYELTKIRDDVDLIWCGTGELENDIRKRIDKYAIGERVHLLGARKDIPDMLCASDLFFLPSRFEGLAIVLIEAQAAGLNCLVSDTVPKMADCGGCQFLSIYEEPKVWAEHLVSLIDRHENNTIDDDMLHNFTVEHMVEQMESLFN